MKASPKVRIKSLRNKYARKRNNLKSICACGDRGGKFKSGLVNVIIRKHF